MVRIINIDTKTRTIRVSNEDKDIDWITVKGTHVPIKKGESKGEAVEKFFEDKGRKFYRGSVVHKDTIDGLKKAKDKHGETMKYWESEGKKNHKEKGYADFVKKEIEAQKQYAKRLDESIADISRDFEIDPEDIGMNKEFDDWKKSKQPAKKAKETYADTSEIEGAEVFKDGDDYVVLYANGTKTREFSSKTEADKFAKSLSKQPAKQESEEKAHRIATNLFSAINTSQFTDAQLKSLISSFIYDEADNLDDDGVVTKDELNSEEFKRLKKFVAEKLAD